jgi:hypothetical protein
MGWTVEDQSRCGRDFPHPSRSTLGPYAASCTIDTGSFLKVSCPGHGADHPPQSRAEGKEKVEIYHYSPPTGFMACCRVNFALLYLSVNYSLHGMCTILLNIYFQIHALKFSLILKQITAIFFSCYLLTPNPF